MFRFSFAIIALSTWLHDAPADDWPQFLGKTRDSISAETGLLDSIPIGGPKLVWKVNGGVGMSAITIAGSKAVTTWNEGNNQVVVCLDAKTGATIWSTPIAPAYKNGQGDGPRATPNIDGDNVFAYSGDGTLACLQLSSGKVIWSVDVVALANAKPAEYGMASSPLVVGNNVIVTGGGNGSTIVAIDRKSGKLRWSAGNGAPGYSSPTQMKIGGQTQVVGFTATGVTALNPNDGKVLWTYPFETDYDCNTATPIQIGDNVFISAGENHGSVLLSIKDNKPDVVWESINTKSVLRCEWQTPILLDGYLYGFDNVGSAGPTTHLTCIEATTGKTVWQKTRFGKGNLTYADGKLWITTMSGEIVMVKATPEKFEELGRATMFGKTRQSLSISNGLGYIRDDRDVLCVGLRK